MSWHLIYLIEACISIVLLIGAHRIPRHDVDRQARTGVELSVLGLLPLAICLLLGPAIFPTLPLLLHAVLQLGGLLAAVLFILSHRRTLDRVLPPEIRKSRPFWLGVGAVIGCNLGLAAFITWFTAALQNRGLPAGQTGQLVTPMAAGLLFGSLSASRLQKVIGDRMPAVGMTTMLIAVAATTVVLRQTPQPPDLLIITIMIVYGLGQAFTLAPLMTLTVGSIEPRKAGTAAGIYATAQQLAGAIGIGALGRLSGSPEMAIAMIMGGLVVGIGFILRLTAAPCRNNVSTTR